jgi:hypothetical protein
MPRRRRSQILLIAGNLLLVAATFVPWLQLSASFSSPGAISGFSPWIAVFASGLLHQTVDMLSVLGAIYLALLALVAYASVGLWLLPPERPMTRFPLVVFSLLLLGFVVFSLTILPIGLMFASYHVAWGVGGALVPLGLGCIYAGSELLARRQRRTRPNVG